MMFPTGHRLSLTVYTCVLCENEFLVSRDPTQMMRCPGRSARGRPTARRTWTRT